MESRLAEHAHQLYPELRRKQISKYVAFEK